MKQLRHELSVIYNGLYRAIFIDNCRIHSIRKFLNKHDILVDTVDVSKYSLSRSGYVKTANCNMGTGEIKIYLVNGNLKEFNDDRKNFFAELMSVIAHELKHRYQRYHDFGRTYADRKHEIDAYAFGVAVALRILNFESYHEILVNKTLNKGVLVSASTFFNGKSSSYVSKNLFEQKLSTFLKYKEYLYRENVA